MAKGNYIVGSTATLVQEEGDRTPDETKSVDKFEKLALWVVARTDEWRVWRDSEYATQWNEYERLWRGIWSGAESARATERSKFMAPALSEAVENAAAEIEEATFGRGTDYFDLQPYDRPKAQPTPPMPQAPMPAAVGAAMGPQGPMPPQMGPQGPMPPQMGGMMPPTQLALSPEEQLDEVRQALKEDLGRSDFAAETSKCILNAAVFGGGVGEVLVEEKTEKTPAIDPLTGLSRADEKTTPRGKLRAVSPRNFLWDPTATRLEDGLGCAIEEVVGKHTVLKAQKAGYFRAADLCKHDPDLDPTLFADQVNGGQIPPGSKTHLIRYYGLVPAKLLNPAEEARAEGESLDYETTETADEDYEDGEYVEAIVVVANKTICAKADANPYTLQDRPVVFFPWDIVPGRLWGRGICEKGSSAAKALNTEIRARQDSLALTTAPMMGMDANRLPRGFKFKIAPGASVLTNGKPSEVMEPFKFGQTDPNHWQNQAALEAMVAKATGSVDATAMAGNIGDARSGAVSMALAPVIKRYKRTMVHFLDLFLMPALEKITLRNMQYDPARYPTIPFKFKAASTMGIMQREYETAQATQLLQTLEPGSRQHNAVLAGIVGNMSIPGREKIAKMIDEADEMAAQMQAAAQQAQQDPMQAQLAQMGVQLQMAEMQAKIRKLNAEASLDEVKAKNAQSEPQLQAMELATKGMYAVPGAQQKEEFDRRIQVAELHLQNKALDEKAADRASNEQITRAQMAQSDRHALLKAHVDVHKAKQKAQPKPVAGG